MGLNVNPEKTSLIMFTNNRTDTSKYPKTNLFGKDLYYTQKVKYLGLTFDSKLLWNDHLDLIINKATNSLWTCRKMVGKLWDLRPKMCHWLYIAIVRPIISYSAIAWWQKTDQVAVKKKLEKLQRLACVTTLAASKSAPMKALEILLDINPLHIHLLYEAMNANCRFKISGKSEINEIVDEELMTRFLDSDLDFALTFSDHIDKEYNLGIPYSVQIANRESFEYMPEEEENGTTLNCFTDGS